MGDVGNSAPCGGHSLCKGTEVWKRMARWETKDAWETRLQSHQLKEAISTKKVVGILG